VPASPMVVPVKYTEYSVAHAKNSYVSLAQEAKKHSTNSHVIDAVTFLESSLVENVPVEKAGAIALKHVLKSNSQADPPVSFVVIDQAVRTSLLSWSSVMSPPMVRYVPELHALAVPHEDEWSHVMSGVMVVSEAIRARTILKTGKEVEPVDLCEAQIATLEALAGVIYPFILEDTLVWAASDFRLAGDSLDEGMTPQVPLLGGKIKHLPEIVYDARLDMGEAMAPSRSLGELEARKKLIRRTVTFKLLKDKRLTPEESRAAKLEFLQKS